ncbi:MAG: ROK family protein [Patescibacteria group bacterium]|nr:ROK family protein [Patescibacteria group bacterium]
MALDIGGTNIRVAASDTLSPIVITKRTFFPNTNNFTKDFTKLLDEIRFISKDIKIEGIGVGIAGQLKEDQQTLREAPNFPSWNNQNVVEQIQKAFSCPVTFQNDAVAGALGEAVYRDYKEENFLYLIWGTGIGGAEVAFVNNAPTAKQLPWEENFPEWEKACGGKSIINEFGKPAESLSEEEWDEVDKRFALHFSKFLKKTSPSRVVFGGGVAINHSLHLYHAVEMMQQTPLPIIVVSSLGETANIMGAFYSLHQPFVS